MANEPLTADAKDRLTFLLAMYKEQRDNSRQHEALRHQSTAIVLTMVGAAVTLATATIAFAFNAKGFHPEWMLLFTALLGTLVVAMGTFGRALSLKHTERSRYHVRVAHSYRLCIDRMFSDFESSAAVVKRAEERHARNWGAPPDKKFDYVRKKQVFRYWRGLYAWVWAVGSAIVVLSAAGAVLLHYGHAEESGTAAEVTMSVR